MAIVLSGRRDAVQSARRICLDFSYVASLLASCMVRNYP